MMKPLQTSSKRIQSYFPAFAGWVCFMAYVGCSPEEQSIALRLNDVPGHKSQWQIHNTSEQEVAFSLQLDSILFLDRAALSRHIKRNAATPEEQIRLAWKIICDYTFNSFSTHARYIHAPEMLISSLGHGYCDDMASALALLWQELGFKARVWYLQGHVVPEVFRNGKWQMYDPDLGLYFTDDNQTTLSVEAIARGEATAVVQNQTSFPLRSFSPLPFHLEKYTTKSDNTPNTWFTDSVPNLDTRFRLPGKGSVSCCYTIPSQPLSSFLKLHLPKGARGAVHIPLLLSSPAPATEVALMVSAQAPPWPIEHPLAQDTDLYFQVNPIWHTLKELKISSPYLDNLRWSVLNIADEKAPLLSRPYALDLERFAAFCHYFKSQPAPVSLETLPEIFQSFQKQIGSWSPEMQKNFDLRYSLVSKIALASAKQEVIRQQLNGDLFSLFLILDYYLITYPTDLLPSLLKTHFKL
ncbi:MAG: transglutaminase-like domain-containing protein [Phaeodactylibacter sp.]|uniref:transglutaminase-like domain-containing protein n=1 Tax=Phaeodactylibacter sp. TaxID=1940289 RepID=UPI0032F07633